MRIIIQRVLEASVSVSGQEISRINKGLLVLLGITPKDDQKLAEKMAKKLLRIRVWDEIPIKITQKTDVKPLENIEKIEEEEEKDLGINDKELKTWHSSVFDNDYEVLVVSQFTLYGILKGNKPDFHMDMGSEEARKMYEFFMQVLKKEYKEEKIKGGRFQEHMHVGLVNDGPVTLIWEEENEENTGIKKKK